MTNEILLIVSVVLTYSLVLIFYKIFNKTGLYVWVAIVAILANIEVLILVDAFGLEQTLGNILFASTFLASDILCENKGKEYATKAVKIGILTNITFALISQSWLLYTPSVNDWASVAINQIFTNTPRLIFAALIVYAISQYLDVKLYHYFWSLTTKYFNDSKKGLWIRNNLSTLISQIVNTVSFTLLAFYGIYETNVLITIMLSSYAVFVVTSLLDTPAVYISRIVHKDTNIKKV